MRLPILIALLSLFGCSAGWHVKRAIKKDPTILAKDTLRTVVTVRDTIQIPGTDTFVYYTPGDSMVQVFRDAVSAIYARTTGGKTEIRYIRSDTTIYREKTVPVALPYEKVVYKERPRNTLGWLFGLFAFVVVVLALRPR